ncbi:MAG: YggS family pyridoxal phosphate-dependent enzyme [Acidobacteria bacterium]|nr:YggS family pyridoxal phosphate-dependent enzyme [Acidobacteriota bacterium]MBV9478215.1 YggS family pyridoxal phosphate-dependent enzyme [Acidobacteriota bacterium]
MPRADEIRANVADVEARIAAACARAGRKRSDVRLVAVTKTFPASDVEHAIAAGMSDVGENKVQEARDKQPEVHGAARWHLIGHLQSNKAKDAVRLFDVIQTVDSFELAEKLARHAEAARKTQDVLLQVNIGRETQKSGAEIDDVPALARRMAGLQSIRLRGLMAIPPAGEPEAMRAFFRELRAMRDDLGLDELSMGMTDDFEVAIEEGATIVRVGRAIFGSRG